MSLKENVVKHNFKFKKSLGQNFISDEVLLGEIVQRAGIGSEDTVVEIGVGGATLTRELAKSAKRVVGFEIDKELAPVIGETLRGVENAEIIFCDFMRYDLGELEREIGGEYSVVANLPYYITTPIIMKLVESSHSCSKIAVMVQDEVARRICAEAGEPDYGAITAAIGAVADAEIILKVGREKFFPSPNVDSAVVKITMNRRKFEIFSREALRSAVRIAFSSRRKTLANNLINGLKISRTDAERIIAGLSLDSSCRGETLTPAKFVEMANALCSEGYFRRGD